MSLNKKITGAVAAVALAALNITSFAGAAEAKDWGGRGDGPGHFRSERHDDWRGRQRYGYDHHDNYNDNYRKNKSDKKVARNLAIGLGVLMLGAILASEANRSHVYRGY